MTRLGTLFAMPEQLGLPHVNLGDRREISVGGTMFITQYRIVFESHGFNQQFKGTFHLLIDTITAIANTSTMLHPEMTITTAMPFRYFLVDAHIDQTINIIAHQRSQIRTDALAAVQREVAASLFPPGTQDHPLRATARRLLDMTTMTPDTTLYVLSLHNLWQSLGQ